MQHPSRFLARPASPSKAQARLIYRRLPLDLYELEPESGEEENLDMDLDLDQLED